MEGLWGRVGAVGAGRIVYVGALLGAEIFLARKLSPPDFGSYKQLWEIFYRPLVPMFTLGVPAAIFYFYPRTPQEGRGRLTSLAGGVLLGSGTMVSLGLLLLASPISLRLKNPGLAELLPNFSPYLGAMVAASFLEPFLLSSGRIKALVRLSFTFALLSASVLVLPVALGYGLEVALLGLSILGIGRLAFAWGYTVGRSGGYEGGGELGPLMRYALPLGASSALGGLSIWVDKAIVSMFYPPDVAGVYMVGAREVPFVPIFLGSVSSVLSAELNRMHGEGPEAMVGLWGRTALKVAMAIFPLFFFLIAFSGRLIPWAFGEGFEGAVLPFRLYLLMLPLRAAAYGPLVAALGRPDMVLLGVAGDLAGNALLSYLLVPRVGPWGAALATSFTTYLHVAFLLRIIRGLSGLSISQLLPWKEIARTACCGLLGISASLPLLKLGPAVLALATGGTTFGAVYLLSLRLWTRRR
ncbi:MAG TPA: polysaccharide biosynthesis protein [Candidatus Latescibacteria bacterium]|nr:polysaccharide biosynthesis protein [Candidatus Latescibacterota bacterium]